MLLIYFNIHQISLENFLNVYTEIFMYTDTKYSENTTNQLVQNMNERKIFLNKYENLSNGSGAAAVQWFVNYLQLQHLDCKVDCKTLELSGEWFVN